MQKKRIVDWKILDMSELVQKVDEGVNKRIKDEKKRENRYVGAIRKIF